MNSLSRAQSGATRLMWLAIVGLLALAQHADRAVAQPGFGQAAPDPRVQVRTYLFEETDEEIPYAVFVSSKAERERPSPLIVALHGLGGNHLTMLRGNTLDLAEEGGYILVGPMGYNPRGWYGIPARGAGAGMAAGGPFGSPSDPPNLRELSEKDVINVLALIRKEFAIDDRRVYLLGHSMGGAGALHLGVAHAETWAAIGAIASAAFELDPASIATVPDLPVVLVHGDRDELVPASISRSWATVLAEAGMTYEYHEVAGGDHGNVISIGMPTIFEFFGRHSRRESP